jgi:hypothetical protein
VISVRSRILSYSYEKGADTCLLATIFVDRINGEIHSMICPLLDSIQEKAKISRDTMVAERLYFLSLVIGPVTSVELYRRKQLLNSFSLDTAIAEKEKIGELPAFLMWCNAQSLAFDSNKDMNLQRFYENRDELRKGILQGISCK